MRTRDLKKLNLRTKLRVHLPKNDIHADPYMKKWDSKIVYYDIDPLGYTNARSSKKIRSSTQYLYFYPKELSLVKE